jgi:bifunctional DNase/RNase
MDTRNALNSSGLSLQKRNHWYRLVLVVVAVVSTTSCRGPVRSESSEYVQVEVKGVSFDPVANSPVVILQNQEQTKAIPIWVGMPEAQAIHLQLQGTVLPRPMTHDLLKNILEKVGVGVEKVVVTEMKGNTYYAFIHLANGKNPLQIDSRPSDAIALALRFRRPIFVAARLFEVASPGGEAHPVKLEPANW